MFMATGYLANEPDEMELLVGLNADDWMRLATGEMLRLHPHDADHVTVFFAVDEADAIKRLTENGVASQSTVVIQAEDSGEYGGHD